MKIYFNNEVKNNEDNGIFEGHFKGFVKTAQQANVVIIIREVNPITKFLLPQKFPTKPSNIKNKSSDWGIQAGFVISLAELTFLNKKGLAENETQIEKINLICDKFLIKLDKNNQNNNKLNSSFLHIKEDETVLTINKKHWDFLNDNKKKFGIIEFQIFLEESIFVHCCQPKNRKNDIILYLEKENDSDYKVYYIFALNNEDKAKNLKNKTLKEIIATEENNLIYFPIPIFCKKIAQEKRPLIPDYDLFAIFWSMDHSIKYHQPRMPTNSFARMKAHNNILIGEQIDFKKIFKKPHSVAKGLEFDQDAEIGNALIETKIFLDKLNKNLGYEKGLNDELRPIHHTFELVNPYAKSFNENFYTIFLPNSELITDFNFPKEITAKNKKNISYFAIHNSSTCESDLWKKFLEPFLIYLQTKGYYVPNNCFVEESNMLGFANSFNPWVKTIRNENKASQLNKQGSSETKLLNKADSGYKSNDSISSINSFNLKEKIVIKKSQKIII